MSISFSLTCDIAIVIVALFQMYLALLGSSEIFSNIDILTSMIEDWKMKPVDSLQSSKFRTCEEIKMNNLINYYWPGNNMACINNGVLIGCSANDNEKLLEKHPQLLRKWKGYHICGNSIKSKPYFELSKSENSCHPKYKPCGIIDTLGNLLCVPENESCPINHINIRKGLDENNFELESNNYSKPGKIYFSFKIVEGEPCINPSNQIFSILSDNKIRELIKTEESSPSTALLNKFKSKHIDTFCKSSYLNAQGSNFYYESNSVFTYLDSYNLQDFYRVNQIDLYRVVPARQINLLGKLYRGWRKVCETKAFLNFFNSNPKEEIERVREFTEESNLIYKASSIGLFLIILACVLIKNKLKSYETYYNYLLTAKLLILIFAGALLYYSFLISEKMKEAKISIAFFELIDSKSCSDEDTDSLLRSVSKDYYNLNDNYFNMKISIIVLSILTVTALMMPLRAKYLKYSKKQRFDTHGKMA